MSDVGYRDVKGFAHVPRRSGRKGFAHVPRRSEAGKMTKHPPSYNYGEASE